MKAADINSHDNNRQDAIDKLITFCTDNGLSYNYTEHVFTIPLPGAETVPNETQLTPASKKRKKFNIAEWGDKGIDETDPDNPDNFKLPEGHL